jgi:DNA-binding LytR/AlgR family response regulator
MQMHRATIVNLGAVESVARDVKARRAPAKAARSTTLSQPYTHHFRQM